MEHYLWVPPFCILKPYVQFVPDCAKLLPGVLKVLLKDMFLRYLLANFWKENMIMTNWYEVEPQ